MVAASASDSHPSIKTDQKRAFIYYKEQEPLHGLQAVFENPTTDINAKYAEVIIPADFA